MKGSIAFEHVSFHYGNKIPVLKDISFSCKPGMMVALVGPTGVGKNTMTQLLSRFYDPVEGTIRIDGTDIRKATLQSLRRNISPVLQDTFLFNGTIAENIGYAKPDATQEEIEAAARAANIHDDIMHMPEQYPAGRSSVWQLQGRYCGSRLSLFWMKRRLLWMWRQNAKSRKPSTASQANAPL